MWNFYSSCRLILKEASAMGTRVILLFALVASAPFARAQPYISQPASPGYFVVPGYAPSEPSNNYAPGYEWRDQRGDNDWRNNTWREDRIDENWRNRNWQTQRTLDDWRQRQDYSKIRTPNNAADRGYVECGKGPVGSSAPCENYPTNTPSRRAEGPEEREKALGNETKQRGVDNCGHGAVWRRC
jgi:hypothetical protein